MSDRPVNDRPVNDKPVNDKRRRERMLRIIAPRAIGVVALLAWHWAVVAFDVPQYIVPSPFLVARVLVTDWGLLSASRAKG